MVIEMGKKYFFIAITVIIVEHYCNSVAGEYGGDTLQRGASVTGNQTLISQNGKFELGFFSPSGTNNWYIGIWYAPISQKAIVWVANRDNPVINKPGVLKFSRDGHLRLLDRNGNSVWPTNIGERGSRAVLMESGNFIILDAHNESAVVWESFRNPTDTLLPGMNVWKGMTLTSWRSSSDPASGLFSFRMDSAPGSTELFMFFNHTVPYWSSGECVGELGQNYFTKVPELEGQRKVQTSCVRLSPWKIYIHFGLNPIDHMITGRFLLSQMGEFELYFWMDDGRWSLRWSTYRGQCTDYEICGAYGLCNANDVCSCAQGFTPKHDSQAGWWSTGCARRKPLQCLTDDFLEAKNQYLPEREAVFINNEPTQQGCRAACLSNCSCTAFAFSNSGRPVCRVWFGDLLGMSVSSKSQSVFIRLAASELQHSTSNRRVKASGLTILLSTAAAFCVVSASVFAAFSLQKRRRLLKENVEEEVPMSLRKFSYKELRIATENFKHKLGSGAFGSVFKGKLADSTPIAVKRLEGFTQAEKQFRAEIVTTGRIQHVNLVRLWGFCVERSLRLLVYAYMPNGSLNSFLFSKPEDVEKLLDWKTRFQIALGTARGLLYLHEECRDRIIHCDIKPENILLDSDFSPKVGDFGLAKLVGRDFSRVLTTTRGTRGYLAPEWISGLPITSKVDVYSFGMTLLEIISGRRNLDLKVEESRLYFPTWASSQILRGNIRDVVDARIASEANIEQVRRAAVVAGLCIQDDENRRPSMGEVVKILEGTVEAPVPQIPRSLQLLLGQVDETESTTSHGEPPSVSGCSVLEK